MPRIREKSVDDIFNQYDRMMRNPRMNETRFNRVYDASRRYVDNIRNSPNPRRSTINLGGVRYETGSLSTSARYPRSVYAPNIRQRYQSQSRGNSTT